MNKKILFLMYALQFFSLTKINADFCNAIHNDNQMYDNQIYGDGAIEISLTVPEKSSLLDKYLRSIIPGLLVGGSIGAVSAYFDHIAPDFWVLNWFVSFWQRRSFVDDISNDMQRNSLPHHKSIMELSSLIASWLIHYETYRKVHGCAPY
jgi:hypothetical protein